MNCRDNYTSADCMILTAKTERASEGRRNERKCTISAPPTRGPAVAVCRHLRGFGQMEFTPCRLRSFTRSFVRSIVSAMQREERWRNGRRASWLGREKRSRMGACLLARDISIASRAVQPANRKSKSMTSTDGSDLWSQRAAFLRL